MTVMSSSSSGGKSFFQELDFPLRIGHPDGDYNDVANAIEQAAQCEGGGQFLVSIELDVAYDSFDVVELTLKRDNSLITYFIDLNHGGIPPKNSQHKQQDQDGGHAALRRHVRDVSAVPPIFHFAKRSILAAGIFKHIAVEAFQYSAVLGLLTNGDFIFRNDRASDKVSSYQPSAREKAFRPRRSQGVVGTATAVPQRSSLRKRRRSPKCTGEIEPGFRAASRF